jgi:hypothetical protein
MRDDGAVCRDKSKRGGEDVMVGMVSGGVDAFLKAEVRNVAGELDPEHGINPKAISNWNGLQLLMGP